MTAERATVLVIDDVADQRELLVELFERAGCDARACEGTAAARDLLRSNIFDIVVVDLLLAGDDDGWKALEVVRELAPDARVVISSVLDVDEFPPADVHLPKPFTRAQVQRLVDALTGE